MSSEKQEHNERRSAIQDSIATHLLKSDASRYLVVGASPFDITRRLLGASKQVTLIDIRPDRLEKVRSRVEGEIDLVLVPEGDEFSGFGDGSFCTVVYFDVLHHFPDKPRVIRETRRILRAGGQSLLVEPNISSKWNREFDQFGVLKDSIYKRSLITLLAANRFEVDVHTMSDFTSVAGRGFVRRHTRDLLQRWKADPLFRIYLMARVAGS
jgi:SAM-dependent methyltransferase